MAGKKNLKMERLSPIPSLDQNCLLTNNLRTQDWATTPKNARKLRRDAYAIETTSSPEVDHPVATNSLKRPRRTRNAARGKSAKKIVSTPLSGLISRKTVSSAARHGLQLSDPSSSPAPEEKLSTVDEPLQDIPEEPPQIDDFSPQKPPLTLNHSTIISARAIFPPKPSTNVSTMSTPLAGIVTKKSSNLNCSLNDSIQVLRDVEDLPDDIETAPNDELATLDFCSKTDAFCIESFESPHKMPYLPPKDPTTSVRLFSNFQPHPAKRLCHVNKVTMEAANVEMCGDELKKRKRALNFNSPDFAVPSNDDDDDDDDNNRSLSPILMTLSCKNDFSELRGSVAVPEIQPLPVDSNMEGNIRQKQPEVSSGFTVSSDLNIESDSYPTSDFKVASGQDEFDRLKMEQVHKETLDSESNKKCDLQFVVFSHDSSNESIIDSDTDQGKNKESNPETVVEIDGRHSPIVELNCTKRPILLFDTPSKASKPFSEAVNIVAFGSPNSVASCGEPENGNEEERITEEEVIDPSTTQEEFVDESEQVRPIKRRKKGSLLERVRNVMAKVDASNALFDYEMKCGLRPSKGKFVSTPLAILKIFSESPSLFLLCVPVKDYKTPISVKDVSSLVFIHVNQLPPGGSEGSVVLVHFPVNIVYSSILRIPYVMAGHQITLHPTEPKIDSPMIENSFLKSINAPSLVYSKPMTAFKAFPSAVMRTLSEAALCQNLADENVIFLTVLHLTKLYSHGVLQKCIVLCRDEEFHCCWVEFSSGHDVKRAAALEALRIVADGSHVQMAGFAVYDRTRLDRKTKHLIVYCCDSSVNTDVIFRVRPKESSWVVSSTGGSREIKKTPSLVETIVSNKMRGRRYLLEVLSVDKGPPISVKDSAGQCLPFVRGENASIDLEDQQVPFLLDGVYFHAGRLFSDEHTRLVVTV